jgi:cobalt-zinc-cadmium efflux system outer membrane protein
MRARAVLLASALLATGCVVPRKAGFDDVQKKLAERTSLRVHWNQGTDEDRRIAEETRRLLSQSLTAETAAQIALFNNPKLQATYERLGVAQAEVVQAGLLRNPKVSLHWGFTLTAGAVDELAGSITGAFLDIFLMPLKKKLANAEFWRAKLEVSDAVLATIDEVRQAFYTVQASTQVVAMRQTMLEAQQAATELAVRQHDAGNLSDLDLSNEQAVYAQARLDLAHAEYRRMEDRERLTRLLGVWGHDVEYRVEPKLPEVPAADPDLVHVERLAIDSRFDLAAARADVQSASFALRVAKGTRVVSGLDVGVQAHRDPDGPGTIGPTIDLELPIFDQKQAQVARLRALLRAAQRRADAMAIAIRSEVREARDRLLAARMTIDTYARTLVPLRQRIVALSQEQYNAMLLGVYQLLQAKQNEIDTYRQYIEAVRDYWIARADLERAVGTRLPDVKADGKGEGK